MRTLLRTLFLFTVIVGGSVVWYGFNLLKSPLGEGRVGQRVVEIRHGATFREVTGALAAAGVLRQPWAFELYGRYRGVDRHIKAGTYAVDLSWTAEMLVDQLVAGTLPAQVRLTLLEGYDRWQVADVLLKARLIKRRAAFLERVERDDLEGRLFPDTYWIRAEASADEVVKVLTGRFSAVLAEELRGDPRAATLGEWGRAQRDLLVMASLVEKEARTAADRPLVARVFFNRLKKGMKLQTDPTCVYGRGRRANPKDCKDPSNRYSTYVHKGLPPGPIANPGRAAIRAALNPAEGEAAGRLLFFVARQDGSGAHVFNETYEGHKAAVRRYLKRR